MSGGLNARHKLQAHKMLGTILAGTNPNPNIQIQ